MTVTLADQIIDALPEKLDVEVDDVEEFFQDAEMMKAFTTAAINLAAELFTTGKVPKQAKKKKPWENFAVPYSRNCAKAISAAITELTLSSWAVRGLAYKRLSSAHNLIDQVLRTMESEGGIESEDDQ